MGASAANEQRQWTLFAIGYQCGFAYAVSFDFYQFGHVPYDRVFTIGTAFAAVIFAILLYLLLRPAKNMRVQLKSIWSIISKAIR